MKNKTLYLGILLSFSFLIISTSYFHSLKAAEIVRITQKNKNLIPGGKEVDAMIGDWIMVNDKVKAVIADAYADREANQMVSSIQGAVIDFTTLESNNDQLVVYYPQGARVDVPSADTIIVLNSKGKSVQLKAVKYATAKEPFIAETTYTLQDGQPYIAVLTQFHNTSSAAIALKLSDRLRCDNDLTDMSPSGKGKLVFIYNKWYNAAYGIATPEGNLFTKEAAPGKPKLTDVGKEVWFPLRGGSDGSKQLAPGEKITLSRILITGQTTEEVKKYFASASGHNWSESTVSVVDENGQKISDAFVYVTDQNKGLVSALTTDKNGEAVLRLDKGDYKMNISKNGHNTVNQDITVSTNNSVIQAILQPITSVTVVFSGLEGKNMPVKIEFRGKSGTKDPFLGPFKRANGAGNLYLSTDKKCKIPLPPGSYDVAFSHGPEYDVVIKDLSLKQGESKLLDVKMARSYRTPGWVIADMHNHTTGSGDTNAETGARVINLAAAGVEFAPATEHNRISTFTGVIKELGLQKYIASSPGVELSGRPGPGDINHQISFPVKIQEDKRGYGAPKTDKDPYVQMKSLYDYDNGSFKFMQHNHPNIGKLYFDKNQDGEADGGFGTASITHALEINGSVADLPRIISGERSRSRLFNWMQMLNLGYRIYGTANSDSHVVSHASGSVFSYIYTSKDTPEKINDVEIAHQVKDGHLVLSNGPFLDVRINKALPGDEIKSPDGKVNVKVKVLASNWCRVNTIQLLINGRADKSLSFTKENNPALFHDGPEVFEKEIPVSLPADAHIIVAAYGKGETVGKVQGASMRNAMPVAMANPVFVDIDGNGFTANKDLLGSPVPTAKSFRPVPQEEEE